MQRRGPYLIGGGATKQIPLNRLDDFFPELFPGVDQRTALALYSLVSWTYRCIQLRANGVMSVQWKLTRRGNEDSEIDIESTPYADVDWDWLWWRTEAARLIWGASYWLKLEDDLQWLNPIHIKPITDTVRGLVGFRQIAGGLQRVYQVDEIVYLPTWNPTDDFMPGTAESRVARPPGALVANANEWTSKFFERGALPATVLSTEKNIGDAEIERVESVWERLFGGVRNAFKTAVLRQGLKPTVIGFPLRDLALPEVLQSEKEQIAVSFGIPITLLDAQAANFATARQDDMNFYTKAVFPGMRLVRSSVNRQLWWPLTYEMHWRFKDVEAIQQDEAEKAEGTAMLMEEVDRQKAAQILTRDRAVWMTEQLWDQLGYTFPDDMPDEEPEEPEPTEQMPPAMLQQQQRMREITQGIEAARAKGIIVDGPPGTIFGYPVKWVEGAPLPDTVTLEQIAHIMATRAKKPDGVETAEKGVDNTAMIASLRRWRRKSKNRKGACEFESDNIPGWVSKAVRARLATAWTTAFDPFLKAPDLQPGLEGQLQRAISAIYDDWLERITTATLAGNPIDLSGMYTEIQAATELMYTDAIHSGALAQAADLGWGIDYDDLLTEGLEFAGREGAVLIDRISGTDREFMAKVQAQLQAGEITEDAARDMLARAFGDVRANTIAVTETTRGLQGGSDALQADLAALGVKTNQRWLTQEDERVCPICGPLDNTNQDEWRAEFPTGPPAHVKCRCLTVVEAVAGRGGEDG